MTNNGTNWCYDTIKSRGIPCQKTGAADYHVLLRLYDKGCVQSKRLLSAIVEMVVPWNLL